MTAARQRIPLAYPPTANLYYGFACDSAGRVGVRAGSETFVEVFDLRAGTTIAVHETIHSGGKLAIAPHGRDFVVSAWGHYSGIGGVVCHDAVTGEVRWHRRDLKRSQNRAYLAGGKFVCVCLDRGGTHLVDAETGETKAKLSGLDSFVAEQAEGQLAVFHGSLKLRAVDCSTLQIATKFVVPKLFDWFQDEVSCRDPVRRATTTSSSFRCKQNDWLAIVSGGIFENRLVGCWAGGPVLAFDMTSGQLLWELVTGKGVHCMNMFPSMTPGVIEMYMWGYRRGDRDEMWTVDARNGNVVGQRSLSEDEATFVRSGVVAGEPGRVCCGHGVYDLGTGRIVVDFR